jgi:predicted alpha/beta superfamily hydrolase
MRRLLLLLLAALPAFAQDVLRLESKVLGETRQILVRTPASYANGAQAYPVLYMTDGDRQLPHTAATVDFLSREGRMPEVILVGISNTDRTRDLTPTHVEAFVGGRVPTSGGADKFLSFIETELIPHIEKHYRTQPFRVFAGHSFGGLFAMHALFSRPKLFDAIIAASPSLTWDDHWVMRQATEFLEKNRELNTTLFFSTGNESEALDREFRALQSLLKKRAPKGFTFEAIKFGDEDHGSVVMPTHYAGLRKVFAPWRFVPDGEPKSLYARARDHYASLSKRAGYTIAIPEQTTNFIGYQLLLAGEMRDAIEVFRANAAAYPNSANVHDSLGEAFEKSGDRERARESYARAAEIGRKIKDPNAAIYEQNLRRVSGSS